MSQDHTMNTIIHAAFRRDLTRFDGALAAFPAGSQARAASLAAAWDNFAAQLRRHHRDEETIFFPALRGLGAVDSLLGDLDGEHASMVASLGASGASMRALRADPSAANAAAARSSIGQLAAIMRAHLAHEERDLEPFAARHATAPELKQARAAIRKAHKHGTGTFFAWLMDGAGPDVTTALRRELPPLVLLVYRRIAGRHYNRHIATVWT